MSLILITAYLSSNFAAVAIKWYMKKLDEKAGTVIDSSMISFFHRLLNIAIYAIALLMALSQFNVQISPLLASLGIAGIAVALAGQELLSNFFGGLCHIY